MTNVEIFGFAPSTYTRTALLIAAEKNVPHTLSPLEFGADSHRALHPFAKMPALKHGDVQLFETAAIAVYLDENFGGSSLQPKATVDRARMWQLISSAIDYFYAPLVSDWLGLENGETPADLTARDRVLDLLETAIGGGDYLVGDGLSLADLFVAPMVRFHADAAGEAVLAARPNLERWLRKLGQRASFATVEAA